MNNTEIEKKYIAQNKQGLIALLEERGSRLYKKHQTDDYYIPKHRNFLAEKYPFEWLRLRTEGDKFTLTYKHWYPEGIRETTHCDEFETTIGNKSNLELILKALDFKKMITVDKTRLAYEVRNFEIALDDVKDLGSFVEIEIKEDYNSIDDAIKQIDKLAKELELEELPENHPVRGGYILVLYKMKHGGNAKSKITN